MNNTINNITDESVALIYYVIKYGLDRQLESNEDDSKCLYELRNIINANNKITAYELLNTELSKVEQWADAIARLDISHMHVMFRNRYFALKPFKYKLKEHRYYQSIKTSF